MNILITGYRGFIGRNLTESLAEQNMRYNLFLYDRSNNDDDLNTMCRECDIVFHLAAVVRPAIFSKKVWKAENIYRNITFASIFED